MIDILFGKVIGETNDLEPLAGAVLSILQRISIQYTCTLFLVSAYEHFSPVVLSHTKECL